jgi:hypothetical protein
MAAMALANRSTAGIWGSQPDVGLSGDYNTNPALLSLPGTAETHGAVLLDAPTTYVGDGVKLSIAPSFRLSDSRGYSAVDSDYEHLNVSDEFDTERTTLKASLGIARDSSLYHDFILNGATGVRRDSAAADLDWDRLLSERVEFNADLNETRIRYQEPAGVNVLTDYKYASISPTLTWNQTERDQLSLAGSVGRYDSLDGATQSKSVNLQAGFTRKLTEIWTMAASGGYSRAQNRVNFNQEQIVVTANGPQLVVIPVTAESSQNGTIFSVNLNRQTSRMSLTGLASRQLAPTGFAYLSRQNAYDLSATYATSERWTVSGDLHRIEYNNPEGNGSTLRVDVTYATLSAAWLCTEHWTLNLSGTRVVERYGTPTVKLANSGISISLLRKFDWKSFQ